jgi:hypothetical protein
MGFLMSTTQDNKVQAQVVDSTDLNSLILSNPCRKCAATKKARCVCVAAGGGADACPDEVAMMLRELGLEEIVQRFAPEIEYALRSAADEDEEDENLNKLELNERALTPELLLMLRHLLDRNLLFIMDDKERGTLSFEFLYNPNFQLQDRLIFKTIIEAVLRELQIFKLENNLAATNNYTLESDRDGNITALRVNFPRPQQYDAFIKRLLGRHLLPGQPSLEQQDRRVPLSEFDINNMRNALTPLSMQLAPGSAARNKAEEEEEVRLGSANRPRSLRDGLKPKNFK